MIDPDRKKARAREALDPWVRVEYEESSTNSPLEKYFLFLSGQKMWTGKWLLFGKWADWPLVWDLIEKNTLGGKLGIGAKISNPALAVDQKGWVACIYTRDYRDFNDVERVGQSLFSLGFRRSYYKTDEATLSGVYAETRPGRVSIYQMVEGIVSKRGE